MGTVTQTAKSAPNAGNPSCAPTIPTVSAGNLIVIESSWGSTGMVKPPTPSGFTELGNIVGGNGSFGKNSGQRGTTIFTKEALGTESDTTVTVTPGVVDSDSVIMARVAVFSKTSGVWDLAMVGKAVNTSGASYSAAAASDPGLAAGDFYGIVNGFVPRARTPSSSSVTWPGATFSGPANAGSTASGLGSDIRQSCFDGSCTEGASTGAPTFTMDMSGSVDGGATAFYRIRAVEASGPVVKVLNGATEDSASIYVWDGTTEVPISSLALV